MRPFKETAGRIIYLTIEQCRALEEGAAQDQNENAHAFVMVGLRTGMRHSEILAIRREDVDLESRVIWIPKAKAGAREQPITDDLADYLARRLEMLPPGCQWLFPSPRQPHWPRAHDPESISSLSCASRTRSRSDHTAHT